MRWMMLAVVLVGVSAAPVMAQHVPTPRSVQRTSYNSRAVMPASYSNAPHLQATVEGHGCDSCGSGCGSRGGCSSGCSSGCCSSFFDNIADVFVSLHPCPGPCSPCVRPVHCCPYPRTAPLSNCCRPRQPTLFDTIFACKSRCNSGCGSSFGGYGDYAPSSAGCTSCAQNSTPHYDAEEYDVMPAAPRAKPTPAAPKKEDPFRDDAPSKQARSQVYKMNKTARAENYYKPTRRAPVSVAEDDETPRSIIVGNAQPLRLE